MAAAMTPTKMLSMKLVIDTKTWRVLFAEADKDVVDFLFSLLALPISTAVALVGKDSLAGSVGNLVSSVEKLHTSYLVPGADKAALLRPYVSPAAIASCSLLLMPAPSSKVFLQCRRGKNGYRDCSLNVTDASGTICPCCGDFMTQAMPLKYVSSGQNAVTRGGLASGFVQGVIMYTIKDDLTVTPMSTISSITLLNTFAVRDISALKEKTLKIGYLQGIQLLWASLHSKTVLTDVFLRKQQGSSRA